jgi:hypothetical protein
VEPQKPAPKLSQQTGIVLDVVVGSLGLLVLLVVETVLLLVLLVDGIVVGTFKSSGQKSGGGASFRLSAESSCLVVTPPNEAQYRFESVPTVSTMPTCPMNGVGSVTPLPLQTATTFSSLSTTRHGSVGEPVPLYL